MDEQVRKILSEQNELLSLPQTMAEVLRVVKDENSSTQDLAEVLLHDPAMTAKVLRIVNSPFYGAGREISTVSQAVATIGFRQVTALALSSSLYNLANQWESGLDRIRFWRHSLETAIAARMIAKQVKYPHAEEAFVAGLLHDLGILILEKSSPGTYAKIRSKPESVESIVDLEEEAWGTNHARVGQFLFEQWNLPESICTAVGHHHDLFAPETDNPDMLLSQIICYANKISKFKITEAPRSESLSESENRTIIRANIGLSKSDCQTLQTELFSATVREAKFLEMEIGSQEELLEEANRMLFGQYLTVENLLGENSKLRLQVQRSRVHDVAQKSLGKFAGELNRYINSAMTAMHNRAELVRDAIGDANLSDPDGVLVDSIQSITDGIETIGHVMKDLTNLACFDTSVFEDSTALLDLEDLIKERLEKLDITETVIS